jgi:tetratricopeptide (TPR) repeat protein
MRAHHRIREEIAACIQKEAIGSSVEILKTHAAFQYALCAKVGFGRPANDVDSEQWLKISGKSIDDLEAEIELLKKNMARGSYKDAYVSNLMARSGSAQYSRFHNDDDLDTVEKIYRREIEDMDFVFGTGSLVVLRHKLFLAGLLEESSVGRYKEAESIRVQIIEESRHRPSWIISPPAQVPASASIWHVEGSEEMLDIRPPELKLGLTFLQNLATLADSQIHYATDNLYGLATSFHRQGRLEEAEWLYVHVRNIEKEESGAVHPHTLDTTFNLAVLYENQGRYREAEKAFTYVTKWRLTWFGKQHPQTLRVQANLAVVYAYLGRLAEAETLLSAVYTEQKRILGPENKLSLLSMKGLEYVHSKHGNLKAMEILRRQRLKVCVDLLGETHPDTLVAMVDVAESLVAQQIWGEADALASEVLKIQTSVVCDDNASRAINMCHALKCLQESLRDQRRWSEAEEVSMRLVEMRKSRLGTTHIQTMTDMWCRGDILWRLGRWREAAICFFNAVPWQYGRFREFVGQFHTESIPFWPGTRSFYSLGTLLLFGIVFQVRRYRKA